MEQETKIVEQMPAKVESTNKGGLAHIINTLEDIEKLADFVANSPVYNVAFTVDSEDGKGKTVSKESIVACIILGQEMGFTPMQSVMLGRRLNQQALIKVEIGKSLGVPPMQAMSDIYIWDSNGRELVYTGIHIVNAALTKCGVVREIIEDGTIPVRIYLDNKTGLEIEYNSSAHIVINDGITAANLKTALDSGKIPVKLSNSKRAKVKLTRGKETITMTYSLQQAIDAGLYQGKDSFGNDVKGKDNWNRHPATMLVKMAMMNAGRIIAADVLKGVYIPEELSFVKDKDNSLIEEANIID